MTTWSEILPVMFVAVIVIILPGLLIGLVLQLRGLWLWAASTPLSMSVITLASLGLPIAGISWGIAGLTIATILLGALAWVLSFFWFSRVGRSAVKAEEVKLYPPQRHWQPMLPTLSLIVAGALVFWRITTGIGAPENISQTFDNIFHLNAVRFILDTENASPLAIGLMNSPSGQLGFYPSGWHALVALITDIGGTSIPAATNAAVLVIASISWVASAVLLALRFVRTRNLTIAVAALLSASFAVFPYLLVHYGVLYPMFLGFSLVPVGLAIVCAIAEIDQQDLSLSVGVKWLLLLGILPGIALSHPGAVMALLAFSVPIVAIWSWQTWQNGSKLRAGAVAVVFFLGGMLALLIVRPPRPQATWQAVETLPQSLAHFITSQLTLGEIPLLLAILVLVGLVVAIARRNTGDKALLGMYLLSAVLYFVAAGIPVWGVRYWVTGVWYQNIPRIEAMTVFASLPLATVGAVFLIERLLQLSAVALRRSSGIHASWKRAKAIVIAAAMLLLAVGLQSSSQLRDITESISKSHRFSESSPLLSIDEREMLNSLDELVPQGVTIVTNGWTGAGLAYAYSGRWVTMPHVMIDFTPEAQVINAGLNNAEQSNEICEAVRAENARYVLDFGDKEVHGGAHSFPGLEGLEDSSAVLLIEKIGDASLYEIVACDSSTEAEH